MPGLSRARGVERELSALSWRYQHQTAIDEVDESILQRLLDKVRTVSVLRRRPWPRRWDARSGPTSDATREASRARLLVSSPAGIVKLPTSARFSPSALSARVSVSRHT